MIGLARQNGVIFLGTHTWANRPSAISNPNARFICSNLGDSGVELYSGVSGDKWRHPSNSFITLKSVSNGWLVPALAAANAATYAQTGTTVTVTSTAHTLTSSQNGKKVYLDIGSGAATDGWYDNFTYVDANSFICTSSVSQSTSGTVNTNTSEITVSDLAHTVLGGFLAENGRLKIQIDGTNNSSGGAKTTKITIDGNVFTATPSTNICNGMELRIKNKNLVNAQSANSSINTPFGGNATANRQLSINTAADFAIAFSLQCAAASDWVAIESCLIEALP